MKLQLNLKRPSLKRVPKRQLLTYGLLVAGVLVSCVILANSKPSSGIVKGEVPTVTYSTDRPDEDAIPANYAWRGNAEDPKYIELPSIKASGFVQKMGVDQRTQIAVPTNINLAGWFANSVRPGQMGLSIIDGHVSGRTADGIFKNLEDLQNGDTFTVTLGNDKVLKYKVFGKTSVATNDAPSVLFSQDPGKTSQLNLITCGGSFNRQANQYEKRVIVNAELQ